MVASLRRIDPFSPRCHKPLFWDLQAQTLLLSQLIYSHCGYCKLNSHTAIVLVQGNLTRTCPFWRLSYQKLSQFVNLGLLDHFSLQAIVEIYLFVEKDLLARIDKYQIATLNGFVIQKAAPHVPIPANYRHDMSPFLQPMSIQDGLGGVRSFNNYIRTFYNFFRCGNWFYLDLEHF